MSSQALPDVYTNTIDDEYPGARERSRPGSQPYEEVYDKVRDSHGNLVSAKPANKPFLRAHRQREEHRAKVEAGAKARAEASERKSAKRQSSDAPSSSRSPASPLASLRPLLLLAIFLPLFSSFLTGTYTFNLSPVVRPYYRAVQRWWDKAAFNPSAGAGDEKVLTPVQLAMYDGADEGRPLYLAIDGEVYDVSENRRVYGPGGSYHMMAGRDASRSFVTGCFETHRTHDLRGLSEQDLKSLAHWKSFFANHEKYKRVGRVLNPPIDSRSPIPPPCDDGAGQSDGQAAASGHGGGRG